MVLTNWVDVIKVRQQLAGPAARNLAATGWQIVRREGPLALGQGITPAVARGVLYGGEAAAAVLLRCQAPRMQAQPASVCSICGPWQMLGGCQLTGTSEWRGVRLKVACALVPA